MKKSESTRITSSDWLRFAASALSEHGPGGLTIDSLCKRLGKTKGSFYAHFESHASFISDLVDHWRAVSTTAIIEAADKHASANERLAALGFLAAQLDPAFDKGMRRLAEQNQRVAEAVLDIDMQRIRYLTALYQDAANVSRADAADLATLGYAAYLGLQQFYGETNAAQREKLFEMLLQALLHTHTQAR